MPRRRKKIMPLHKERNASLDVYRCILMYGICLLHSVTQAGHNVPWVANMLEWCVTGFVFMSGWYGVRFSFGKLFKLYWTSIYCAVAYVSFDVMFSGGGDLSEGIMRVVAIAKGQWYLNAYAVLLCLSPMLNAAVKVVTVRQLIPLCLCAFGWSFATTLPIIQHYIPKPAGIGAYTFLTLVGVYVIAGFIKNRCGEFIKVSAYLTDTKILFLTFSVCLGFAAIGLGDYNSPFSLVLACSVFMMFKGANFPVLIKRFGVALAPSMFSVYLIHAHGWAWGWLSKVEDAFIEVGLPSGASYFATAFVVFSSCLILAVPRRVIESIVMRVGSLKAA